MLRNQQVDDTNYNEKITFHFSVDGAKTGALANVAVVAGHCSPPIVVPVGNHTVKELLPYGFQLVLGRPPPARPATTASSAGRTR